uniref:F-box protein AT5G49610-like beta-propeller domain-containing protein n=2 Tax=Hordeum vulgare subsp. vulgare TaxID=112509 RepID=A0A8I6XK92_HORVV
MRPQIPPPPTPKSLPMATRSPPPQRRPTSPPALIDDLMREIFLRVRGDDPASLVRSAACCWSWHRMLSHPDFAVDYRKFHGAAPMLGFLYNETHLTNHSTSYGQLRWYSSHFVSTATFRPPACRDRRKWRVLDSRHGLVLFDTPTRGEDFVVYDLVTGEHWEIRADPSCHYFMWWPDHDDDLHDCLRCNATVLCAKDRCDHLDCRGGPFRVAFVGCDYRRDAAHAAVYSSEACEWTAVTSVEHEHYIHYRGHRAVVGDKIYVPCMESDSLIVYNMGEQELSVINPPFVVHQITLMGVEDGMLLFASVVKPTLLLWSMEAGPGGAARWARHRVIELESLLPTSVPALLDNSSMRLVGFAEGLGVIFLSTKAGLYTIELSSRQSKRVHESQCMEKVMPYTSFYTGEWGPLLSSHEASPAVGGGTVI